LNEKVVTALCLAFVMAVLFGGPMVGKGGRLSGDVGKVARLGKLTMPESNISVFEERASRRLAGRVFR
jgi:hypothetical protein